jgi:transposase
MGRSRGGLSTKIHALVDAEGRPIRISLTPGQAHDGTAAEELLANLTPGTTLLADKAYDSNAIREQAQEQDVWANIPPKSNRKGSFAFSTFLYRYRNLVERFFNKLKQFRGIATRYDRIPENFLAAIKLVSTHIWIAVMGPRLT